jgi:hypothetical protein
MLQTKCCVVQPIETGDRQLAKPPCCGEFGWLSSGQSPVSIGCTLSFHLGAFIWELAFDFVKREERLRFGPIEVWAD